MCFYMVNGKCYGVKEYAIEQVFEMIGPLPAPHQKWSCCYKTSSREMKTCLFSLLKWAISLKPES